MIDRVPACQAWQDSCVAGGMRFGPGSAWVARVPLLPALLTLSCGASQNPAGPSPLPQPNSTINYMAIAASDGLGVGSSAECPPLVDCPNGNGYVQVAVRQLTAQGFIVNLTNPSIPTATLGRDFQDLGNKHNHLVLANFVDNGAPFTPANSTFVTIFAGGNDVNVVTTALGAGEGASDQIGYINDQVKAFGADYTALLNVLRTRAPSARIVALNLPNMGAMPFLAGASLAHQQAAQRLSVGMTTTVINPLTARGVLVVDMMCDPRSYQAATYSSDGFHPGDFGYAWMAAEVVSTATSTYKSPQSSCSQMSLVPG
jgi:lysophospholipase L1-like esterase